MSAYLILDVDDFSERGHHRALSVGLPDLAVKLLTGAAFVVGLPNPHDVKAIAVGNWSQHHLPNGQPLHPYLEANGFKICQIEQPAHAADFLCNEYFDNDADPVDELILVTSSPALLKLANCVSLKRTARVRVWADQHPGLGGIIFQPLDSILKLQTKTVALYVDFEDVAVSLNDQGYSVNLDRSILSIAARASAHGHVTRMAAYAPWGLRGSLPPLVDDTGYEVSDDAPSRMLLANIDPIFNPLGVKAMESRLAKDALADSLRPDFADVFIVASGSRDYSDLIATLQKRGKEVIVWGIHGHIAPTFVTGYAMSVDYLDEFLHLERHEDLSRFCAEIPGSAADGFLPSQWSSLILQFDRFAAAPHCNGLPIETMLEQLRRAKVVVSEPRGRDLLSQAVTIGILCVTEQNDTQAIYPNPDHPVVKLTRLIRDRIMLRVETTLDMRGWSYVNRGFLLRGLAMDPKLDRPGLNIDDSWRAAWVDCLVREGILVRELAPRTAQHELSAVRMNASR